MLIAAVLWMAGCAGAHRGDPGGTGAPMRLVNRTNDTVCYLYLSPPGDDDWGSDWLGSDSLDPGESQTVNLPPGQWDLRTENCQHETTGVLRGARMTRATTLVLQ